MKRKRVLITLMIMLRLAGEDLIRDDMAHFSDYKLNENN
jgi:hypothetical protein